MALVSLTYNLKMKRKSVWKLRRLLFWIGLEEKISQHGFYVFSFYSYLKNCVLSKIVLSYFFKRPMLIKRLGRGVRIQEAGLSKAHALGKTELCRQFATMWITDSYLIKGMTISFLLFVWNVSFMYLFSVSPCLCSWGDILFIIVVTLKHVKSGC